MKKYFAIFAAVAILGMLAIYFVPSKKLVTASTTTSQTVTVTTPTVATDTASTQVASPTPAITSQTTASGNYKNGSYTGSNVSTRFGTVKVAITVSGGKITNVDFLSLPNEDMRSSMISSQARPLLESQTLAAQSSNIDGVSGATYTSNGYVQSLQSAIDAAKI